jgi:rubrerythrin
MSIRIDRTKLICAIVGTGLLAGCASTVPPPLPPGNPADATIRVPTRTPDDLLLHDETTVAIQSELSQTASIARSAETMQHDMNNMPGMQHGGMEGMQHEGIKMEDHKGMPPPTNSDAEKKALADQMKKTSDEMKRTSDEMKEKAEQTNPQNFYYTCPIHPQIHADKPGKCPICGMTLIKKEGAPPK